MAKRRRLQELTIKDNFMFAAVMTDPELCRGLLERALGIHIGRVDVDMEKCMVYHPEYKGVRLDVYAEDEEETHYNVEMQVARKPALGKRTRYYHSQIDMELLPTGQNYEDLPDAYVIFICDFDPFGKEKYRYMFENRCLEDRELVLDDGSHSIFLSTCGKNDSEVPEKLVKFLEYVKAKNSESTKDFEDTYVKELQNAVQHVKKNREMEGRYMIFEEMMRDEYAAGKAEGKADSILELLEELGPVPEELKARIVSVSDLKKLSKWLKLAAKTETIEQFMKEMEK